MAASAAYGFRPSSMDGRGAFAVRRAAGEEDHRSGTARNAPGASGTLHPSNCPGGEHGLHFRPSLVDGRGALSCVAQSGKRIVAVEPPGTRRARVVRCIRPIARAGSAACGFRPSSMDGREAFPCVVQPGKEIAAVELPGCAGREGYVRLRATPVQSPGRCARLRAVFDGRTRSLSARRAAGEGNQSGGIVRNAPGTRNT